MPDRVRAKDTLCSYPSCRRVVWQDPDGSFSSFCGKTHRDSMKTQIHSAQLCKHCQARPVYIENNRRREFCGVRCANAFKTGVERSPEIIDGSNSVPYPGVSEVLRILPVCKLEDCQKPVFIDQRRREASEFCCNRHRLEAVESGQCERCLKCRQWPKLTLQGKSSDFCGGSCRNAVLKKAPVILPLLTQDNEYARISSQFQQAWKHPSGVPAIHMIWKIYSPPDLRNKFEQYKLKLERKTGYEGGNSRHRWHGTVRMCSLGDDLIEDVLCLNDACCLCHIIRSSFKLAKFGQRTNFGRFGEGIYTSATSSKADAYVASKPHSGTRAMLFNYVAMGKAIVLKENSPNLKKPPAGYDSVVGEPGDVLNYDESIVYDNDAIRPNFLVVYSDCNNVEK